METAIAPLHKITNADQILFRAHMVGEFMDSRDMKGFTDTQIDKLAEIYAEQVEGRREEITSKYLEKGNVRENDSLTLKSCVTKKIFNKNEIRLSNEFVTAIPDAFIGKDIYHAEETSDVKSSWSRITFLKSKLKKLNKNYKWQGVVACALTGAKKHSVDFCLVNGTADHILNEKRIKSYQKGMLDEHGNETPLYIEKCKQIEINFIFDFEEFYEENPWFDFHNNFDTIRAHNIPMNERLHTVTFERNEDEIKALYERIKVCREFMNANLFKL